MASQSDAWNAANRETFWSTVRGFIARQGLRQAEVAEALHLDRSVLSRRLSGEIQARPDERMIDQLSDLLKLSPAEVEQLRQLAGYAMPVVQVEATTSPIPPEAAPEAVQPRQRRRWLRVRTAVIGVGTAALVALAAFLTRAFVGQPVLPGGVWVAPQHNETIAGPMHFAARAYARRTASPVAFVEFTVSWSGRPGPWMVACHLAAPVHTDLYECDFDPVAVGVPPGPINISFDVYDENGGVRHAPHGVRTITYVH
jgi:transcriptional regulator with XRE-family HTH domain